MKFAPTIAGNLAKIEAALRRAVRRGADAVLFPECATTGYSCAFEPFEPAELAAARAQAGTLAARLHLNVLVGSPTMRIKRS